MALISSPSKLYFGLHNHKSSPNNPSRNTDALPFSGTPTSSKIVVRSWRISAAHGATSLRRVAGADRFARVSSSRDQQQSSSVGVNPINVPRPPPQIGSPLFLVTVGVALSAAISWGVSALKKYAMQQAFKTVMGQMDTQNNHFSNAAFPAGSPFGPFTPPSAGHPPATSSAPVASQSVFTVNVPTRNVETAPKIDKAPQERKEPEVNEPKKTAFVDVSPEETFDRSPFQSFNDVSQTSLPKDTQFPKDVSDNGAASKQETTGYHGTQSTGNTGPSFDAIEKMLEDPAVQKMLYPYLPEERRNPETFKMMLEDPQSRQQLQDMLNYIGGSSEWDQQMDSLKNFDLNSTEVKEQFDQIGLTPEEVISKIMANPEVAMAFQNPKVQAAIMDCSQNPMSIMKYQNDKEVMDVFNKISELFPGVTG